MRKLQKVHVNLALSLNSTFSLVFLELSEMQSDRRRGEGEGKHLNLLVHSKRPQEQELHPTPGRVPHLPPSEATSGSIPGSLAGHGLFKQQPNLHNIHLLIQFSHKLHRSIRINAWCLNSVHQLDCKKRKETETKRGTFVHPLAKGLYRLPEGADFSVLLSVKWLGCTSWFLNVVLALTIWDSMNLTYNSPLWRQSGQNPASLWINPSSTEFLMEINHLFI